MCRMRAYALYERPIKRETKLGHVKQSSPWEAVRHGHRLTAERWQVADYSGTKAHALLGAPVPTQFALRQNRR